MGIYRINNNLLASNAMTNLQRTNSGLENTITRLSTGLRINSAADDPAGLIKSESFRAQIGGIKSAISNNQDAINYVKTADSAMQEVNGLLNDARALAVSAANSATLDQSQKIANQNQLNSIVSSINNIASRTSFGKINILDGSAGTYAASTSAANVSGMNFTGVFNNVAIVSNSAVTVAVTTAATQASLTGSVTYAAATTTVAAGSFNLNGVAFTTSSNQTIASLVTQINNASNQTGVTASFAAGSGVALTAANYGSNGKVQLVDANGILNAAGATSASGVDAVANVTINNAGALATVAFNKGNGLNLQDSNGNSIVLTAAGNATTTALAWGGVFAGQATFQVGANQGQTQQISLGSMSASNLGLNAVNGLNLSNLDLNSGAQNAIAVIDKAIQDVSTARANLGNIQRNVIESNIRSLGVAKQSLTATESRIRDADMAEEITAYTKFRIMQQAGLSMLAQANSAPQGVLALLS